MSDVDQLCELIGSFMGWVEWSTAIAMKVDELRLYRAMGSTILLGCEKIGKMLEAGQLAEAQAYLDTLREIKDLTFPEPP